MPKDDHTELESTGPGVVLLVEDDPSIREVTRRVLARGGFTVHAAEDATRALEILDTGQTIDLVLTDLSLAGENGGSIVRRALELAPERPVLIMSGRVEGAPSVERLLEQVSYLQKPFTRDALIQAVRSALARHGEY